MTLARPSTALMLSLVLSPVVAGWLTPSTAEAAGFPGRGMMWVGSQGAETPAPASRTPATVLGTKEERVAKAAGNYAKNRPVEAALGFEGLWKDFPAEVDFLFNAAASRMAAGHFAHAVAYTREYLAAKSVRAEDRAEAEAQLREALTHTTAAVVTVVVEAGENAGPITLVAEYVPRESADLRPDLLFSATPGAKTVVQVDPGVWTLRASGSGYVTAEQRLEVGKGPAPATTLRLTRAPVVAGPGPDVVGPTPAPGVPPETRRGLKLGFGIGGGVVAATGVALVITGAVGAGKGCTEEADDPCADKLATRLTIRDAGVMGLGAGLGLAAGGLTWLADDAVMRKKIWIAEAAVGGAGLIVGLVLMPVTAKKFNEANVVGMENEQPRSQVPHALVTTLAGFGIGALVSSVTGLIVQHRHLGNVRMNASLGRGQAGLMLSGRF